MQYIENGVLWECDPVLISGGKERINSFGVRMSCRIYDFVRCPVIVKSRTGRWHLAAEEFGFGDVHVVTACRPNPRRIKAHSTLPFRVSMPGRYGAGTFAEFCKECLWKWEEVLDSLARD
jgi:hypothetical protein